MSLSLNVKGQKEVQKKLVQVAKDLTGNPMKGSMAKATLIVQRAAVKNAPVDRGVLRASITPEVRVRDNVVQGIVGSSRKYAPYQELGTRPFWPPWAPLFRWAMRKTGNRKSAGALAQAARISIAARGIKAKRFLQQALEDNTEKIFRVIQSAVATIVEK